MNLLVPCALLATAIHAYTLGQPRIPIFYQRLGLLKSGSLNPFALRESPYPLSSRPALDYPEDVYFDGQGFKSGRGNFHPTFDKLREKFQGFKEKTKDKVKKFFDRNPALDKVVSFAKDLGWRVGAKLGERYVNMAHEAKEYIEKMCRVKLVKKACQFLRPGEYQKK
uniref:DUF148 domain-containing protein n=1 Tax=Steinernema glaseri TaxID=37863 RepID=A0A1I7XVL6_9BILA